MTTKIHLSLVALSALVLSGCANNPQSASSTDSSAETYTNQDLQRTGKRDSGEAVRSVDPAVTTTTNGR